MSFNCPYPINDYPIITLAHGGGGKLTQRLIQDIFVPAFGNSLLNPLHDGAILANLNQKIAITTDSYVVDPLFFPGGNIGELAITGTVNDLAMCGAKPLYMSCSFILTEGLKTQDLIQIVDTMRETALSAGVKIVTGDTKVIEKSKQPGLYINTTGIGEIIGKTTIGPQQIKPGDAILLSGDIGRHGMAIMAKRENLDFTPPIESDCALLSPIVNELLNNNLEIHCMRDLTRGGLSGALIELAESSSYNLEIMQDKIPISQNVHAACELLGLDPMYVANEGRMIIILPKQQIDAAIKILHQFNIATNAVHIGEVLSTDATGIAILKNNMGVKRQLHHFSGEQLPRIC